MPPARGKWFCKVYRRRAGIALMRAAKAQALISGRDYVAPDDVQAVLPQTIAHRLVPVVTPGAAPWSRCAPWWMRFRLRDGLHCPPHPHRAGWHADGRPPPHCGGAFARGGRGASNAPTPWS